MDPQTQQPQLDQSAVLLAKAIRQTESGGNPNARGKSGEFGAYQFTPSTWQGYAHEAGVNVPLEQSTLEDQNKVAYSKIKQWKDQGYNVGQVASMWNSGQPDNYNNNHSGVNSHGVAYDTPKYAKSVATAYQTLKNGGQVGMDPNNPSSVSGAQQVKGQSASVQPEQAPSVGGFLGNVLKSGAGVVGGIGNALLHPVQTVTNLGNAAQGAVELLIPGEQGHEDQARAIGKFFADRYGGLDKIKNSLYNDPVGVALDLSTVLGLGAGAVGGAGKLASLAGASEVGGDLSRVAGGVAKAAEVTDPLHYVGQAVGKLGKFGAGIGSDVAGNLSGAGGEAVRTMYNAGKEGGDVLQSTTDALRGKLAPDEVLQTAQSALQDLRDARRQEYLTQFNDLVKKDEALGRNTAQLPFDAVQAEMRKQLENFGIKIDPKTLELDFSTSTIGDRAAQNVAREVYGDVANWKDLSPQGLDTLKRRLDSYYKETGDTRALVQSTKAATKKVLTDNIPGYAKMTKGYEEASDALKEAQSAVGSSKMTQESSLRRIRSIFRDAQKERLSTVESVQAKTGRNIKGQAAGMVMNQWMPGGLAKYGQEIGGIAAVTHPAAIPALLPGLLASSPRAVGEVARALGMTSRNLEALVAIMEKSSGLSREQVLQLLLQGNRTKK